MWTKMLGVNPPALHGIAIMPKRLDLSKPAHVLLREELSELYGINFTEKNMVFHPNRTQQYSEDQAREIGEESFVRFDWVGDFDGQRYHSYTQTPLQDLIGVATVRIPPDGPRRTDRLTSYIYDQLGIRLDPQDIWIEWIPEDAIDVVIKLSPRHLALKGEIRGVYSARRLEELLTNAELDGFTRS